jgi:hypothetical protein
VRAPYASGVLVGLLALPVTALAIMALSALVEALGYKRCWKIAVLVDSVALKVRAANPAAPTPFTQQPRVKRQRRRCAVQPAAEPRCCIGLARPYRPAHPGPRSHDPVPAPAAPPSSPDPSNPTPPPHAMPPAAPRHAVAGFEHAFPAALIDGREGGPAFSRTLDSAGRSTSADGGWATAYCPRAGAYSRLPLS